MAHHGGQPPVACHSVRLSTDRHYGGVSGGGGGCGDDGCSRKLTQGGIGWDCGLTARELLETGHAGLIRRLSTFSWVLQVTLEGA